MRYFWGLCLRERCVSSEKCKSFSLDLTAFVNSSDWGFPPRIFFMKVEDWKAEWRFLLCWRNDSIGLRGTDFVSPQLVFFHLKFDRKIWKRFEWRLTTKNGISCWWKHFGNLISSLMYRCSISFIIKLVQAPLHWLENRLNAGKYRVHLILFGLWSNFVSPPNIYRHEISSTISNKVNLSSSMIETWDYSGRA